MPDNLTRREFLKDLGLMGAGVTLGPVAAQGESFDSFLERADHGWKPGPATRPAWVKEVDKPTIEIDWEKVQRYDPRLSAGNAKYYPGDRQKKLQDLQVENTTRYLKENRPGYTLRDWALMDGANVRAFANVSGAEFPFLGLRSVKTPEQRGVPKYTATPEEAAKVVAAAMRFYGAGTVGFVELDPKTTQKLIYANDGDGKILEFADVDVAQETKEKRVIPNKARWAIVFTAQMSVETQRRAPTPTGAATTYAAYEAGGLIQTRTQEFLRALGYQGIGEASRNALGIAPAFGVMAGLGELSRVNRLVTPEYGPVVRVFKMLTDLPLAPTKPINAGIFQFCHACKKCADSCPSKALSFEDPTWNVKGGWNNPGHKTFYEDSVKCRSYWYEVGTGCAICFAACPFATKDQAFMYHVRNMLTSVVPGWGGIAKNLDDVLYGATDGTGKPRKDPTTWWDLDLPEYGIDTMRAKRDSG
ncbi:MAG: reductive dehalogenase [Chloroflexi bacterium]|nr:reductive dehalogenase [Chloroflexota bacterium]